MACPFFYPTEPRILVNGVWPARVPLHVLHDGTCKADDCDRVPDAYVLESLCNFGYARGKCEWFHNDQPADAVRFSVVEGELVFVLERDCAPVQLGKLAHAGAIICRQAEAFLQSYPQKLRTNG